MTQTELEALSAIIEQMEQDASQPTEPAAWPYVLRGHARQLNVLVKASKPTPFVPPPANHRVEIERAKEEFRQKNSMLQVFTGKAEAEEEAVGSMVMIRGGANHGVSVPGAKPSDQPGTHVVFGDEVYTLAQDRNFDFNEDETKKYRSARRNGKA